MKTPETARIIEGIVFGGLLAGISLCAPLWVSSRAYPLTPLFHRALLAPPPFDALLVVSLVALGIISIALPKDSRPLLAFVLNLALLLLLDQSRWQPWVFLYFFLFIGLYLIRRRGGEVRGESMLHIFRLMLVAQYLWSAIQKMNVSFLTESGPALIGAIPLLGGWLSGSIVPVLLMPVAEALVGIGLVFPKTRRPAVVVGALMHALILLALSPLGMNWNTVVWPWNIVMIALLFTLFWPSKEPIPFQTMMKSRHPFMLATALFFVALPALNFAGLWDSYLSFALYSDNVKQGVLIMRPEHLKALPEAVWGAAERQRNGDVKLRQFSWSILVMNVPRYPEERVFRSGLRWMCEQTGDEIRMEIHERPHWLTKERDVKTIGCDDL